jgi:DNA sulfur modification protein DndB
MTSFEFTFPALRGKQAGRDHYVVMCPLELLPKLFPDDDEEMQPELETYRAINTQRVPEIVRYVVQHPKSYVLSTLTASILAKVHFDVAPELALDGTIGKLRIPMSAQFVLHDGRHRCAALKSALRKNPGLSGECISLVLYSDPGGKRTEQIFTDIKGNERRSPKSLSILHDARDEIAKLTREMISNVAVFGDAVEMVKTTISNRSRKLFTLSAIYQATRILLAENKSLNYADKLLTATDFWTEIARRIPDWSKAVNGEVAPAELRKSFVHAHGIALSALGRVGQTLLAHHPKGWRRKLGPLRSVDWSRANAKLWEGRAMIGGRLSKANSCIVLTGNAIKQHLQLPLSDDELLLERQHNGES